MGTANLHEVELPGVVFALDRASDNLFLGHRIAGEELDGERLAAGGFEAVIELCALPDGRPHCRCGNVTSWQAALNVRMLRIKMQRPEAQVNHPCPRDRAVRLCLRRLCG
jgi:hypothetical protein